MGGGGDSKGLSEEGPPEILKNLYFILNFALRAGAADGLLVFRE